MRTAAKRPTSFFHYLDPHADDACWGVRVIAGGRVAIPPRSPYPPLGHPQGHAFIWSKGRTLDEYQVVLIGAGGGIFRTRSGDHSLTPGDAFILFPGIWHSYQPNQTTGWSEYWLAFDGDGIDRLVTARVVTPEQPVIPTGQDPELREIFEFVLDRLMREPPGFRAEMAAATLQMVARLSAISAAPSHLSPHQSLMRTIAVRIQETGQGPVNIASLANEAGFCVAQFRRVFRNVIGMSPKAYHQHIRLVQARHMLGDHRLRIKDVAERMGFGNEFYFSRLFTRHQGMSPVQWRRRQSISSDFAP